MSHVGCGVSQVQMVRAAVGGYPVRAVRRWQRHVVSRTHPAQSLLGYLMWAVSGLLLILAVVMAVLAVWRHRGVDALLGVAPVVAAAVFGYVARKLHAERYDTVAWSKRLYEWGTDRSNGRRIIGDLISDRNTPQPVRDAVYAATTKRRECSVVVEGYQGYWLASLIATDGGRVAVSAWRKQVVLDLNFEARPWFLRVRRHRSR